MGVIWTLTARLPGDVSEAIARAAVQAACDRVVAQMSTWEPGSDLWRFGRAPAGSWMSLPPEFATVMRAALDLAEKSGGAFDPTLGPLEDLWGFGPAGAVGHPPAVAVADRPGWRELRLEDGRLLQPGGVGLDLSGIAKGFGVDLAFEALAALGVRDILLEIGGELRGGGVKGVGEPWWVDVERPPGCDLPEPPIVVALHGLSIATSGDWRRSFEADGRRYHHTLDPATGAPAADGTCAVTVVHQSCLWADAYCTALTVLGSRAEAFAQANDIAAVIVRRTGCGFSEHVSPAFRRLLD